MNHRRVLASLAAVEVLAVGGVIGLAYVDWWYRMRWLPAHRT